MVEQFMEKYGESYTNEEYAQEGESNTVPNDPNYQYD